MSFILDALKKSETERQQQSGAEFSSIPSSSGEPQSFKWLWILGLLLVVNVVVLLGILLRPDKESEAPPPTQQVEQPAAVQGQPAEPSFEERIAEARENQPSAESQSAAESEVQESAPEPAVTRAAPASRSRLMTIDELRLNGTLQLPELHIDIHVFADNPAERFVFINMTKYREKSQLAEGPTVSEITNDGVILEYRGSTFLLPRE
jgi:general secretion pathway protein B